MYITSNHISFITDYFSEFSLRNYIVISKHRKKCNLHFFYCLYFSSLFRNKCVFVRQRIFLHFSLQNPLIPSILWNKNIPYYTLISPIIKCSKTNVFMTGDLPIYLVDKVLSRIKKNGDNLKNSKYCFKRIPAITSDMYRVSPVK